MPKKSTAQVFKDAGTRLKHEARGIDWWLVAKVFMWTGIAAAVVALFFILARWATEVAQ